MSRILFPVILAVTLAFLGCGSKEPKNVYYERTSDKAASAQAPQKNADGARTEFISAQAGPNQNAVGEKGNAVAPIGADLPSERKIIFTGILEIEVKAFGEARKQLDEFVRKAKAYYSKTEILGDSGKKRSGTFGIKVPVEKFQTLVDELTSLGNPLRNHTDSQDVTEEFVDTAARVKNLKAEEDVLNKLLKEAGSRLEDVFKIREQIRNNRLEIERNEARVLSLGKMAALSTLTV